MAVSKCTNCKVAPWLTLDPYSGQDLSRSKLAVDRGNSDAPKMLHLLLELDGTSGLPVVVQLMEKALRPLVYETHPVSADLHTYSNRCEHVDTASICCLTWMASGHSPARGRSAAPTCEAAPPSLG